MRPISRAHVNGRLPLVFLHGLFGSPENWDGCVRHLSPHRRVERPSLPLLTLPPADTNVRGIGDWVLDWLHRREIGRVALCGNSLGGHAALHVALTDPARVAALVLTGSSGLFERGFTRTPSRPSREWIAERARGVFYDDANMPPHIVEDVFETVRNREMARRFLRIAKSAKQQTLRDDLGRVQCPVLLVWGTDDRITPPSAAREFQRLLPRATLAFIDRCGHAPMMERPEEFSRHVALFLDEIDSLPRAALRAGGPD